MSNTPSYILTCHRDDVVAETPRITAYATSQQSSLLNDISKIKVDMTKSTDIWVNQLFDCLAQLPEKPRIVMLDLSLEDIERYNHVFPQEVTSVIPYLSNALIHLTSIVPVASLLDEKEFISKLSTIISLSDPSNFDYISTFLFLVQRTPVDELPDRIKLMSECLKEDTSRECKYIELGKSSSNVFVPNRVTLSRVIESTGRISEMVVALKDLLLRIILVERYDYTISLSVLI